MAQADDARAKELAELARHFFLWLRDHELPGVPGFKGRRPDQFLTLAGVYRKLTPEAQLMGGKIVQYGDADEARRLKTLDRGGEFVLLTSNPEEQTHDSVFGWLYTNQLVFEPAVDLSQRDALWIHEPMLDSLQANLDTLGLVRHFTFTGLIDKADLVFDDLSEAQRIKFKESYRWIFDYEAPRPAYQTNVRGIVPIDDETSLEEFRTYLYWHATYANRAKAKDKGGDYYAKWAAKNPLRRKERTYHLTKLSTTYIKETFYEYVLQREQNYILILAPTSLAVYRLMLTPTRGGRPPTLDVKLVTQIHRFAAIDEDSTSRTSAFIFHALDGGKNLPATKGSRGRADLTGVASGRYAYDYKAAVRWYFEDKVPIAGDDHDWFLLFVHTFFADAVYAVDGTHSAAEQSTFSIDELMSHASDATGPIRKQLERAVASCAPGQRFVMQGWEYGETRSARRQLIGVSNGAVYEWYPETGLVTRMGLAAWYEQNRIGAIFAAVHANTRGAVPFMMAVTFGGVAVAGGAVIGGAVFANLARTVVRSLIQDAGAKRVAKALVRQFRGQLVAVLADGVLSLLPDTKNVAFELLRGFVHGFGVGAIDHYMSTLDDRFEKELKRLYNTALNKATAGVNRIYQTYLKLSAAYTKLCGLFEALKVVWTEARARAAAEALKLLGAKVGVSLLIALFVAVYVDYVFRNHDRMKRDTWVKHQRDVLKLMIKETGADLADHAAVLRADLSSTPPSADLIRERNDKLAAKIADAVLKAPTEATGVLDILQQIFEELGVSNWDELMKLGVYEVVGRGLDAMLANHPGLAADQARVLGEALGELVGTVFLERAVLPKKWRKSITGSKHVDRAIKKTLVGGSASALWRFAKFPLDELSKVIPALAGGLRSVPNEHDKLFERVKRDETAYRDLVRDLLTTEGNLASSISQLSADVTLPDRIRAMVALAQSDAPPDIETVLTADDPLWPRDAILFILQNWLRTALLQLLRGFELIEDDVPYGGTFRIAALLELLGLDVALDDKTVDALRITFDAPAR